MILRRGVCSIISGGISRHIYYRRLSTLCSDDSKLRNFHNHIRNLATLDVLRVYYINTLCEVQLMLYLHFGYNNISAWASRCCSNMMGNAKASNRGTTTVEFHVFFVPFFAVRTHGSCVRSITVHLFFYINEHY